MEMKQPPLPKPGYQDRVKQQTLRWAEGKPYHNTIDDECCPDFSCCRPELFETDAAKRWEEYRRRYGTPSATWETE